MIDLRYKPITSGIEFSGISYIRYLGEMDFLASLLQSGYWVLYLWYGIGLTALHKQVTL